MGRQSTGLTEGRKYCRRDVWILPGVLECGIIFGVAARTPDGSAKNVGMIYTSSLTQEFVSQAENLP